MGAELFVQVIIAVILAVSLCLQGVGLWLHFQTYWRDGEILQIEELNFSEAFKLDTNIKRIKIRNSTASPITVRKVTLLGYRGYFHYLFRRPAGEVEIRSDISMVPGSSDKSFTIRAKGLTDFGVIKHDVTRACNKYPKFNLICFGVYHDVSNHPVRSKLYHNTLRDK